MLAYSLARGSTLTPLIEETIGDVFDAAVEKWPDREAVVSRHERKRYSYRALQVEVNRPASEASPRPSSSSRRELRLHHGPSPKVGERTPASFSSLPYNNKF